MSTSNIEVTRDAPGLPPNAPDPNVVVPAHVRAAAEAAEAIHKQAYQAPEPAPEPQPEPVAAEPQSAPEPAPQPAPLPPPAPEDLNVSQDDWRHRFLSMQGRYNAAKRDNGAMEEQLRQIAEENVRLQALIQPQATPQRHENLITDQDRENVGDEILDVMRRAARETVAPELEALRAENAKLTQRVTHTAKRELFSTLDERLPSWRTINNDPGFISWLRLPNVYTGQLRGKMLKDAVAGAEAPKVMALFKDFLAEAAATGQTAPTAQREQPAPTPAPRTPALDLETLAAPGRARPASGDSQVPSEKPIYSRADISKFYEDSRKGLYAGRETEYRAREADLQQAQREGRIR